MRTVSSVVVHRTPWLSVREDVFARPDGSGGTYTVVDKDDFAVVIAEQNGGFQLVEQFRYPLKRRSWEFPMGGWPAGKSGNARELAEAELAEETGFRAASWTHLGHLQSASGFCSQGFDVFYATDLTPGPHRREVSELDMVQAAVSETELITLISGGTIDDSATVAAFGLLMVHRRSESIG